MPASKPAPSRRPRQAPRAAPKTLELAAWGRGLRHVAGVDEVGRGPLAGPVVAAAVIFAPEVHIPHVTDSKQLSPTLRETLAEQIKAAALTWGVGLVPAPLIDAINILQATRMAMRQAIRSLDPAPELLLVDGWELPDIEFPQQNVIGGDRESFTIAAASILAKVHRDRIMQHLHALYPEYGFAGHKGYASRAHLDAIAAHGPCPAHRRSFSPFSSGPQEALDFGE